MIEAQDILRRMEKAGIEVITGVPDSTLKQFCDGLQTYDGKLKHYVTVNEGAAVGLAIGTYLASGRPACVYMQNSGIGNAVNPIASLAHGDVYGIPMLFVVGWRGEPGTKDEPQHVFQGKATLAMLETLEISYDVIGPETTDGEMDEIWERCLEGLDRGCRHALVVKKGTFAAGEKFVWENGNSLNREQVLGQLLQMLPQDAAIVSTTGKISRELYEQSNALYGGHDRLFMTVGGMGHASMIAYGIAAGRPDQKIVCIDGDGAELMHMGSMAFIASQAPENYTHIVINNLAHESVGAMPTGCQGTCFAEMARAAGYVHAERITTWEELDALQGKLTKERGPVLYEIMVSLEVRSDLGRPVETAGQNREHFMKYLKSGRKV